MKIRLEGSEKEINTVVEILRDVLAIASVSKFYGNDGGGEGRVYVNLLEPKGGHVNDEGRVGRRTPNITRQNS